MYQINLSTGEVTRLSDGKVVAPCQSAEDPDFLTYIAWVMTDGNEPIVVDQPV